jgi:hypothetical protein
MNDCRIFHQIILTTLQTPSGHDGARWVRAALQANPDDYSDVMPLVGQCCSVPTHAVVDPVV